MLRKLGWIMKVLPAGGGQLPIDPAVDYEHQLPRLPYSYSNLLGKYYLTKFRIPSSSLDDIFYPPTKCLA